MVLINTLAAVGFGLGMAKSPTRLFKSTKDPSFLYQGRSEEIYETLAGGPCFVARQVLSITDPFSLFPLDPNRSSSFPIPSWRVTS
jgi:hypothetical protein